MAKHAWLRTWNDGLVPNVTSGTAAGLGTDKLLDPQPRHRMRVAAGSTAIIYDLGSALPVDCFALISTTITSQVSTSVRIRASTADPNALTSLLYDSGVTFNVTDVVYNGNVIGTIAAPVTARYWRVDIFTLDSVIDIGLIKIGQLFKPGRNYAYGAREGRVDLSTREKNPHTGGDFCTRGVTFRTRLITIAGLTKTEVRESFQFFDFAVGAGGDVLWIDDPEDTAINRARDSIWGSFREIGADLAARIASQNWARSFRLTERL